MAQPLLASPTKAMTLQPRIPVENWNPPPPTTRRQTKTKREEPTNLYDIFDPETIYDEPSLSSNLDMLDPIKLEPEEGEEDDKMYQAFLTVSRTLGPGGLSGT